MIVGAALRGWIDQGARHVLLTGYDKFSWVINNPTGDFVTHQENLDEAMQHAFGARLLTKPGTHIRRDGYDTYRYEIRDAITNKKREVVLSAIRFPVEDQAINPASDTSIWKAIAKLKPHAAPRGGDRSHAAREQLFARTSDPSGHQSVALHQGIGPPSV